LNGTVTEQRRANVARAVVIAPPEVMLVLAVTRRQCLEHTVQVVNGAWLEFDRRHTCR